MPYDHITACLMTSAVTLFPIKAVFWHTGFQNSAYEFCVRLTDQLLSDDRNPIVTIESPIILNHCARENSSAGRFVLLTHWQPSYFVTKESELRKIWFWSPCFLVAPVCRISRLVQLVIWSKWKRKIQVINSTKSCWRYVCLQWDLLKGQAGACGWGSCPRGLWITGSPGR